MVVVKSGLGIGAMALVGVIEPVLFAVIVSFGTDEAEPVIVGV